MTKLSVSSQKLLNSCETRYAHYKVYKTPNDADYTPGDFLGFGSAFHQVLELTKHTAWNEILLLKAVNDHNVDHSELPLLRVMLDKYVQSHKKSGLEVVYCELGIETHMSILFIDAIAIDKKRGGWWIVDLKTAGRHDENLLAQLPRDMQMNLYAHYADQVELAVPEVAGLTFLGCRYRQVTKSKASTPKGLESGVKVYDIEIPVEVMDVEANFKAFEEAQVRAVELHQGEAPKKNYGACFNYFSPCPYFSKCHGTLFTEGKGRVVVHTIETDYEPVATTKTKQSSNNDLDLL